MAKRKTKVDLEREIQNLEAKVARLEKLQAVPGEFWSGWRNTGECYLARKMPEDAELRNRIYNFGCELVSDSDTYPREEAENILCLPRWESEIPGVDAVIVRAVYTDNDGFIVEKVWPAIKVN